MEIAESPMNNLRITKDLQGNFKGLRQKKSPLMFEDTSKKKFLRSTRLRNLRYAICGVKNYTMDITRQKTFVHLLQFVFLVRQERRTSFPREGKKGKIS